MECMECQLYSIKNSFYNVRTQKCGSLGAVYKHVLFNLLKCCQLKAFVMRNKMELQYYDSSKMLNSGQK